MGIDWFTVGAQVANFLVLVWLLQRFLYGPVTRAMAGREQRIAERIGAAEEARADAQREAEAHRTKRREIEDQREAVLAEAHTAAAEARQRLEAEAREQVEARRRDWHRQLEAQQDRFLHELRDAAADHFWTLAQRALEDLADDTVEDRIAASFARRIEALDPPTAEALAAECARHDGVITVRSRFPLSSQARRQVTRALHERLGLEAQIDYAEDPALGCGIELLAGHRVIRWSLAAWLEEFKDQVAARLAEAGALQAPRGSA